MDVHLAVDTGVLYPTFHPALRSLHLEPTNFTSLTLDYLLPLRHTLDTFSYDFTAADYSPAGASHVLLDADFRDLTGFRDAALKHTPNLRITKYGYYGRRPSACASTCVNFGINALVELARYCNSWTCVRFAPYSSPPSTTPPLPPTI